MRGHARRRGSTWTAVWDEERSDDGKRRQRWKGGFSTKRAAEEYLTNTLGEIRRGEYVKPRTSTVGEYLTAWLPTIEATVRPTTYASYGMLVEKHIIPRIGSVELQRLTAATLDSMYAQMLKSGRRHSKGGLSPRTVRYTHAVIRRALAKAVRQRLVTRNVADDAEPPAKARLRMKTWTPEELKSFLEHVKDDRLYAAFLLSATTGARRGEVLGASWRHLDLNRGELRVVETLVLVNYKAVVSTPKTDRGRRVLHLDAYTTAMLREHRKRQITDRLAAGEVWQNKRDLVFTDELGQSVHPQAFSEAFGRHVKASGLPMIKLHELRHTHATMLLRAGQHPAVVSERLGHFDPGFTLAVYTDSVPSLASEAAEKGAELLGLQTVSSGSENG